MVDQSVFSHPDAPPLKRDHWRTVRWNAAFMAATLISEREKYVAARARRPNIKRAA